MLEGLIGTKIGMSQVFNVNGDKIAVTLVHVGPCAVLEKKVYKNLKYTSLLLGYGDVANIKKNEKGFFDKIGVKPKKHLKSFRFKIDSSFKVGDLIGADFFKSGDYVDVRSRVKGRGFQGVIKRHNFHRGPMSHGSRFHRRPGSIGMCADPSRVFKGKKMPGRMGGSMATIQSLKIFDIELEDNILIVQGAISGASGTIVHLSSAIKRGNKDKVKVS